MRPNEDGTEPTPTCLEADIQDTASKRWEEPVASNLDLEPEDATNEVGSQHTVTATVTDQFDQGVAGVMVRFEVTGTNSETVTEETDENGQATHTYSSLLTGEDTIIACMEPDGTTPSDCDGEDPGQDDNSDLQDAATKTWESTPEQLVLDRDEATNTVGDTHQTTATVTDGLGDPVEGAVVRFEVDDQREATATTDSGGEATFSYATTDAGDDTITACTTEDGSEPEDCPTDNPDLNDSQTKHWQPGAPAQLDLEPEESTNTVGTDHTVDATVTDEFDNPVPGVDVRIEVRGETTETVVTTDDLGEASFTYTGPTAVQMHTIDACTDLNGDAPTDCPQEPAAEDDDRDLEDAGLKWWEAGPPATITLTPDEDTNVVGEDHEVTATVTDQHGNRLSGIDVRFEVTREGVLVGLPPTGQDTTDQDGNASFTYTNGVVGIDTITGCTDQDGTAPLSCLDADVSGTATKEWTLT